MPPEESVESRVAVLESRINTVEGQNNAILTKLDNTLIEVSKERIDMAEERGTIRQYKLLIPVLTGTLGFMGGTLVTLIVVHIL
jgi:hypothetical protein